MWAMLGAKRFPGPQRTEQKLAVAGAGLGASAAAAALVLADHPAMAEMAFMVPVGALLAVGTLIIVRRGRNVVGWLCWLGGLLAALAFGAGAYAELSMSLPGGLPGALAAGWFDLWLGTAWVSVLLLIPLVFPDGRLPSARWRPVALVIVAWLTAITTVRALNPAVPEWSPLPHNPLGVGGAAELLATLERASLATILLPVLADPAALLVRFRRSRGTERLQLKWLLYALALVALLFAHVAVAPNALPQSMSDVVFLLGIGTLPIAIGVAVLRYRLYDIDLIIRRTIVYAVVTAALSLVYAGGVLVAGSTVSGGRRSDLVVAISTLTAAALFRPLRSRTQELVDRRFNRQRFDAANTVAAFSDAVRHELNADALVDELLAVTGRTVQPEQLWLWRPSDVPARAQPRVVGGRRRQNPAVPPRRGG